MSSNDSLGRAQLAHLVRLDVRSLRKVSESAEIKPSQLSNYLSGNGYLSLEARSRLYWALALTSTGRFSSRVIYDWKVGASLADLRAVLGFIANAATGRIDAGHKENGFSVVAVLDERDRYSSMPEWPRCRHYAIRGRGFRARILRELAETENEDFQLSIFCGQTGCEKEPVVRLNSEELSRWSAVKSVEDFDALINKGEHYDYRDLEDLMLEKGWSIGDVVSRLRAIDARDRLALMSAIRSSIKTKT